MKPKLVPNADLALKRSLSLRMIEVFVLITLLDLVASLASDVVSIRSDSSPPHPSAGRSRGWPSSSFNPKSQEIAMPINKLRATPRAKALIALIVAAAVAGYVAIFSG